MNIYLPSLLTLVMHSQQPVISLQMKYEARLVWVVGVWPNYQILQWVGILMNLHCGKWRLVLDYIRR